MRSPTAPPEQGFDLRTVPSSRATAGIGAQLLSVYAVPEPTPLLA